MRFFKDLSLSAATAGFVAVLVGGVGSAFGGVVADTLVLAVQHYGKADSPQP